MQITNSENQCVFGVIYIKNVNIIISDFVS